MSKKENRSKPEYNLLDFLKTFGIQSTTNFDLLEMAEYLGLLDLKVIMKDELKDSLKELSAQKANAHKANAHSVRSSATNKMLIINYQNKNQKGSHWVAAFFVEDESRNGDLCYYFDSFGLKPLDEIYEMFSSKVIEVQSTTTTNTQLIYNKEVVQHYETEICGQLCIYFLFKMMGRQDKEKDLVFKEIISELKALYDQLG